jgi:hypothetical protein
MIELPKQLLFISLVVSLLFVAFVFYSMRGRVNQLENDMNSMFNLVSSLNDEQKKLGNLVMYSIQQQEFTNKQHTDTHEPQETQEMVLDNEGENKVNSLADYETITVLPMNDTMLEPKQDDLRVVVSDDESDSDDDNQHTETDIATQFNKFNKMKVNELKNVLDTLSISKSEIAKAKKLKKTELVAFIVKNQMGISHVDGAKYTSDEDDVEKDDESDKDSDSDDDSDDALSDSLEDDTDELVVELAPENKDLLNDIVDN